MSSASAWLAVVLLVSRNTRGRISSNQAAKSASGLIATVVPPMPAVATGLPQPSPVAASVCTTLETNGGPAGGDTMSAPARCPDRFDALRGAETVMPAAGALPRRRHLRQQVRQPPPAAERRVPCD